MPLQAADKQAFQGSGSEKTLFTHSERSILLFSYFSVTSQPPGSRSPLAAMWSGAAFESVC